MFEDTDKADNTYKTRAVYEALRILQQAGINAQWVYMFGGEDTKSIITLPGVLGPTPGSKLKAEY